MAMQPSNHKRTARPSRMADRELRMAKSDKVDKVVENRKVETKHTVPFRFLDLPAEVRCHIYELVLPKGLVFSLESRETSLSAARKWTSSTWVADKMDEKKKKTRPEQLDMSLFYVSKFVSSEARSVLYGANKFEFTVDSHSHLASSCNSLQSVRIFGAFGTPERMHLLRDLKDISIVVDIAHAQSGYWVAKRIRARLEYFISVVKEYSDDENRKSLLQRFTLVLKNCGSPTHGMLTYALEPLAGLRGIRDVCIEKNSVMPQYYVKCLELCIKGKGGDVLPLEYPEVLVENRPKTKKGRQSKAKGKDVYRTTRMWYHPQLNWGEFGERNGIPMSNYWANPEAWANEDEVEGNE